MDRMACVDLPDFPLQLLLGQHPEWRNHPAAVVDHDRPQGVLLWVNERARAARILPGLRYAAASTLSGELRAAEVPRGDIDRACARLHRTLTTFTPGVEPAADEPGVVWLDASGLQRLYDSLVQWGNHVRSGLKQVGYQSTVVVGFTRFGTYAVAKSRRGVVVFRTPAEECAVARRVPLDRLALPPAVRETLGKLGVTTLGEFVDLPAEGLVARFGPEIERLHRLASGQLQLPLQPARPRLPAMRRLGLDHAETDVARLMVGIEGLIRPLLAELRAEARLASEIQLGFRFERLGDHIEKIRPASPTLDERQLLELIRLRLQAVRKLPDGVVEIVLAERSVAMTPGQRQLFTEQPRRDLAAANRALARLRAGFGEGLVLRAELRQGHLPEASYAWEKLGELRAARPREVTGAHLVRRIHDRPQPLPARPRQEPDGWMLSGLERGPVTRVLGPYVVSGGWWHGAAQHREYHFAETQRGEMLWVFYDRPLRRWYVQGRVE